MLTAKLFRFFMLPGLLVFIAVSATLHVDGQGSITSSTIEPKIVESGKDGAPPSDALVLFNGKNLDGWLGIDGKPANWLVKDGDMIVGTYKGSIQTKQEFGDVQLHIEWATPAEVAGDGQGRGNSGVFFMGRYEVQILDSYNNKTYIDGQAAAVYKQYPPLVNVSRKPGEWQTYDIIFHAPAFDEQGKVTKRARVTVLHNGVLVQDNVELIGSTSLKGGVGPDTSIAYTKHAPKAPLMLQDHHNPVRFRNIWVRNL